MLLSHYGNQDMTVGWGRSGTDNNGNVLRGHHYIPGGIYVNDYEYDALNRIKKDTGWGNSNYVQAFDYDRFGNRTINQSLTTTSVDINKKLFSVNTANNRLGVPTGQTGAMNYDAVGNLIFDSYTNPGKIDAMTYDAENHMTSAANGGHQYRYNAEGKRVKRIISGQGEFWMVYGIGGELVAEYNATSSIPLQTSPNKEYGYRNGQMLVVWDDTETTANLKLKWLVTDQLGSTRMEIGKDGAANAVVRHDYLAFGEELAGSMRSAANGYGTATKTKQKFTSKQRDDETGLDFFEARHYSSIQGRFTTPDEFTGGPVEVFTQTASANPTFYADLTNPQSLNKYQYTYNNPLRYVDPNGHEPETTQQVVVVPTPAGPALVPMPPIPVTPVQGDPIGDLIKLGTLIDNTIMSGTEGIREATGINHIRRAIGTDPTPTANIPAPPITVPGIQAQPQAAPAPMQAGSTKNERKVNEKRYEVAKAAAEGARETLKNLKSTQNATQATKKAINEAQKALNRALDRMRRSEPHGVKGR